MNNQILRGEIRELSIYPFAPIGAIVKATLLCNGFSVDICFEIDPKYGYNLKKMQAGDTVYFGMDGGCPGLFRALIDEQK